MAKARTFKAVRHVGGGNNGGWMMAVDRDRQEKLGQQRVGAVPWGWAERREWLALGQQPDAGGGRGYICARVRGGLELVPIGDVVYFQADLKYTTVRHKNGEVVIGESLASLEADMPGRFIRVHRNALVAKSAIAGIAKVAGADGRKGRDQVVLYNTKDRLDVSRRHLAEVRRLVRQRKGDV